MVHDDALLPTICYLLKTVATVLGAVHPGPAAPGAAQFDEDGLPVPVPKLPEPPITPVIPNWSVIYIELS